MRNKQLNEGNMPCTARAIRGRLKRGFVVRCLGGSKGFQHWQRVRDVRFNEGQHWKGLWVQECGGLQAWFSPDAAKFEVQERQATR
jgi:hypothetical protein